MDKYRENYPYDMVWMAKEEDEAFAEKLVRKYDGNMTELPMIRVTTYYGAQHILNTEVIDFIVEAQFLHLPVPFEIAFISLTKLCKMLRRKPNRKFHLNDILRLDLAFLLQLHCNGK